MLEDIYEELEPNYVCGIKQLPTIFQMIHPIAYRGYEAVMFDYASILQEYLSNF